MLILVLFQSCGGSGGGSSSGDPNTGGNTPFVPDGPERGQYTVPSPKDSLTNYQWHLDNKGLKFYTQLANTSGEDINHDSARENAWTGHGVLVAVSDNGTETSHPDLSPNILSQYERNYSSSDPNAWHTSAAPSGYDAIAAHGTAVAGLIAAVDGNGEGGMGVAPRSKLAIFKYVGTGGSLNKAIDQANGPFDIFNYSYGRSSCTFIDLPQSLIDQYKYGVETLRNGKGAIYVKAAGNEYISGLDDCVDGAQGNYYGNANLEEEHSYPYMIVVGAFNADGLSSSYSTPGSSLWLVAPGGEYGVDRAAIITTDLSGCGNGMAATETSYTDFDKGTPENSNCNYTNTMNGSSAATPIVSGVAALILEANPNLSWREVKHVLASTARKIDPNRNAVPHPQGANLQNHTYQDGWLTNSAGYHFHNWYGFGAADANAAVEMAANYGSALPALQETNWAHARSGLNLNIPDSNATGVSDSMPVSNSLTIEAVQIKITLDHTYAGDLGVELTSPSGMKSIVMHINSNILETNLSDALLLSNAFYGENSQGTWTLKVIDGAPADTGVLKGWKLNFYGHSPINGNLLAKSSNSPGPGAPVSRSITSTESNVKATLSTETVGGTSIKTDFKSSQLKSETKKYDFKLIFKNKITTSELNNFEVLDHEISENGKIIELTKKNEIYYINEIKLDKKIDKIFTYKNHDEYILANENELFSKENDWIYGNQAGRAHIIGKKKVFLTEDNYLIHLQDNGENKIEKLGPGYNGIIINSEDIETWNFHNGILKTNSSEFSLDKKINNLNVVKIKDKFHMVGFVEKKLSIQSLSGEEALIFSGLNYFQSGKIKSIRIVDNVIHILVTLDKSFYHIGLQLNEK